MKIFFILFSPWYSLSQG